MAATDTPLRKLRIKRELTLATVARKVKTDVTNLSRIERGMQVSPALAERLVKFFGRSSITEEHILYPHRFLRLPVRVAA